MAAEIDEIEIMWDITKTRIKTASAMSNNLGNRKMVIPNETATPLPPLNLKNTV